MRYLFLLCLTVLALGLTACGGSPTGGAAASATPSAPEAIASPTPLPQGGGPGDGLPTPPADATVTLIPAPGDPTATPLPTEGDTELVALPAPLYYLSGPEGSARTEQWQIMRLDANGLTSTPITNEPAAVQGFDVSPIDGSLAYISGLEVVRTDAQGGNRTVLYTMREGQAGPHPDVPARLSDPRWSPDGTRIAFGLNGINIVAAAGGSAPDVLLPNTYAPDGPYEGNRFYTPHSWSPDGSRLLVRYTFYPEGGTYGLMDARTGALTELIFNEGMPCCEPAWSADSASFYLASSFSNFTDPGLWRIDAATGEVAGLVVGDRNTNTLPNVTLTHAQLAPDGSLYAWFYPVAPGSPPDAVSQLKPYLARVDPALAADPAAWQQVNPQTLTPLQTLWAADFSGVVAAVYEPETPSHDTLTLTWVPVDGSPAVRLPPLGFNLRWAQR